MEDILIKYISSDEEIELVPKKPDLPVHRGLYVDTETTGLEHEKDEIWEIGGVHFEFQAREIVAITDQFTELQMPSIGINEIMTKLSGVTEEELDGKVFDMKKLNEYFQVDLIVAHNAPFDRKFLHRLALGTNTIWACSRSDVDWKGIGQTCQHLRHLCMEHQFVYDGHRAVSDCMGAMRLLTYKHEGQSYFNMMIQEAMRTKYRIVATKTKFNPEVNAIYKEHGLMFNGDDKVWWKDVYEEERHEICDLITQHGNKMDPYVATKIPLTKRFLDIK